MSSFAWKPKNLKITIFIADTTGWGVSPRGAGYLFGSDVVANFNHSNSIDMICRAHQLVMEGFKWHFNETVLTVWSAPNYCYRYFDQLIDDDFSFSRFKQKTDSQFCILKSKNMS